MFNFHQNCVERNGIVSFWKNDYQLHENWQLAAVLAGLQGRGSSREKEGNVIQQIFFCYSTTSTILEKNINTKKLWKKKKYEKLISWTKTQTNIMEMNQNNKKNKGIGFEE